MYSDLRDGHSHGEAVSISAMLARRRMRRGMYADRRWRLWGIMIEKERNREENRTSNYGLLTDPEPPPYSPHGWFFHDLDHEKKGLPASRDHIMVVLRVLFSQIEGALLADKKGNFWVWRTHLQEPGP